MFKQTISLLLIGSTVFAQTIAEKKAMLNNNDPGMNPHIEQRLQFVNETLWEKKQTLQLKTEQVYALFQEGANEETYRELHEEIQALKEEIYQIQEMWRRETSTLVATEGYALWHQSETTLLQLVLDYGATDYLYIVPPDIGSLRISLGSHLPIPREAWEECLQLILQQNGVGVHALSPYLRQLYCFDRDNGKLDCITDDPKQLELLPSHARVCFILSPNSLDPRRSYNFLAQFANNMTTSLHLVGGQIFIVSSVDGVGELLKLHQFSSDGAGSHTYKLVPLTKVDAEQMQSLVKQSFGEDEEALQVTTLGNALFLSGSKEQVQKGEKMIHNLEGEIEDPKEKTVFWYTAKHSDAEELSSVLAQVYELLISGTSLENAQIVAEKALSHQEETDDSFAVKSISVGDRNLSTSPSNNSFRNNFIVDPKTGAIIMVVEQEALQKIQKLLKRLDVPKKMVQLEVLLFEKKTSAHNNVGLNLLRLGSQVASGTNAASLFWNPAGAGAGILEFLISRKKGSGIPAYDLSYNFLLGQEDVQINASPSVTTVNQTPATIALVEEVSINTGAEEDSNGNFRPTYSRKQFGIKIQITPTINQGEHEMEGDGEKEFITLDTDITFDTPKSSGNSDRPTVSRRYIKNHVRIADGETVILGGLRLKTTEDSKDSIPFLGEIPGLGKLFSSSEMSDTSTEMFIFITPKIISDPIKDANRFKRELLKKRPGDLPEFLVELVNARKKDHNRLFQQSMTALFGRKDPLVHSDDEPQVEYDGRS